MNVFVLTLFPQMFSGPFDFSIVKRAKESGLVSLHIINLRDFATDRYKTVDDHPYGGGVGMVMRVDVIDKALKSLKSQTRTILLDPTGTPYTQAKAKELSRWENLILICGHYEGVDERVRQLADEEISIGDYILTGGEIPAMVIVDSVVRLIPGVLKNPVATESESFSEGLLEYPQYTRPRTWRKKSVPTVLLSGDHKKIAEWRTKQARLRTKKRRPDLISGKTDRV